MIVEKPKKSFKKHFTFDKWAICPHILTDECKM
jgi:hypothetical protein